MSSNRSRNAVLTAFLVTLLAAAGCTGTEVLVAGQETLNVEVELVNTETRFESAYFEIRQLSLRPLDPDADASLSADAIGVLRISLEASYGNPQTLSATASLGVGTYQVTSVVLAAIAYNDLDPPASTDTCQEYVSRWNQPNTPIIITDFGEDIFITIENDGTNSLALTVDGAALENAFLNSWTCAQQFACVPFAPWCLRTFLPATFAAQAGDFIDFPSQ
jgi:hypothetical protein